MMFEMHGVWCSGGEADKNQWVDIRHVGGGGICLHHSSYAKDPVMTPDQARYLATKLRRLARLIDEETKGA